MMSALRAIGALLFLMILVALPALLFADTSITQLFAQLEQQYQLPAGILGKIAQIESGGNPNAQAKGSNAVGLFQWLPKSWEAASKALYCGNPPRANCGPLDPSLRTSPVESAKVTAFALADTRSQIGSLITQAQVDMTVGLYLGHFLGTAGARRYLNAYIQNPGQGACALFPKACAANGNVMSGRTLAGVINYFAQKLKQPGVVNIAGNFQDGNGISYAYSSADLTSSNFLPAGTVIGTDSQYDYPPTYGSPPQTPPSAVPQTLSQPALTNNLSAAQQTSSATNTAQPQLQLQTQSQTQTQTTASTTVQTSPAALIIVQPLSVMQRDSVIIAWTSVGMKPDIPCAVLLDGTILAEANEGSRILSVSSLTSGGLTFQLSCTSLGGQAVTDSASATVQ